MCSTGNGHGREEEDAEGAATKLRVRPGNWIWESEVRGEDLYLAYLLPWSE